MEENLRKQSKRKENRREYENIVVASKKFNIQKANILERKKRGNGRKASHQKIIQDNFPELRI